MGAFTFGGAPQGTVGPSGLHPFLRFVRRAHERGRVRGCVLYIGVGRGAPIRGSFFLLGVNLLDGRGGEWRRPNSRVPDLGTSD